MKLLERVQQQSVLANEEKQLNSPAKEAAVAGKRRRGREEEQITIPTLDVRIRPELNLDYAGGDISSVEADQDGNIELTTTFMGLYGISSPLPTYYTEELLDDEWDNNTAPRDFLDIIHQHLYPLLFKAWQKYRFAHQTVERGETKYWDVLYSLIGFAEPEFKNANKYAQRLLPYLGLLSQRQKSISGLETILRDALNLDSITIEPCVARDVAIPKNQYALLGLGQVSLGQDATIGQSIHDRMGKAILHIKNLSGEQFQALLTDNQQLDFIRSVCKFYLVQPLEIEVLLSLNSTELKTTQLGANSWSALGQDTWLEPENLSTFVNIANNKMTQVSLCSAL